MHSVETLAAGSLRVGPGVVLDAWRGITPRQLLVTFLLGCALFLFDPVRSFDPVRGLLLFFWDQPRSLVVFFTVTQIKTFGLLLAVVVADRVTGTDPDRRGAYALAIVAGASVGQAAAASFGTIVFVKTLPWAPAPSMPFLFYRHLDFVLAGGAVVWLLNDRRRAARARARMRGAELDRIAAERRSIESDLQALQARVEPQFLFNTLAQVKRLYERDAGLGERMIDELIAYLRAAMPKMRDTTSSIGQELELARAYLAIVKVRLGERLRYEIASSPAAEDAHMPPMMLLPLVDRAIARGSCGVQARVSIAVRTAIADGKVRLQVVASGDACPDLGTEDETVAGIRERLAAIYGRGASLVPQRRSDEADEAVIELPFETVEQRADRDAKIDAPPAGPPRFAVSRASQDDSVCSPHSLPSPQRPPPVRSFAGLTWSGIGLVLLVCVVDGIRRTAYSYMGKADPSVSWMLLAVRFTGSALVIALPVVLAVVAAYNLGLRKAPLRYAVVALALVVSSLVGVVAAVGIETSLECGGFFRICSEKALPPITMIFQAWVGSGSLCALLTVVYVFLRVADESDARARQAETDRARFIQLSEEARLRMLQAQIEPHFLFNTLANVRRLYQTDPANAATMLDNLMRYLEVALPQMRDPETTLGREAALAESYLNVQKVRMGGRLEFDIEIPGALREARLPPMIVLTLAENAIKHGLAPLPEGGHVGISATTSGKELQVHVVDSGRGFTQSSGGGTGLANIDARLAGLYGAAGRLTFALNPPRGVIATISVPLLLTPITGQAG